MSAALNATNYDGITNVFDWSNPPEGVTPQQVALLQAKHQKTFDLLTKVRNCATELLTAIDKATPIIASIQANGLETTDGLPPFPLPGTLTPLSLSILAPGLASFEALQVFLSSNLTLPSGSAVPSVVPMTIFRQIAN